MADVDEDALTLDPSMPAEVQGSPESVKRWRLCVGIAGQMSGLPADSSATEELAREFYFSEAPTEDREPLEEGQFDFDNLHPRNRLGQWRDTPDRPKARAVKGLGRAPASPGTTIEEIEALGLNHWPEPGPAALKLVEASKLSGELPNSAEAHYAQRPASPGTDSAEHPPYKARRRVLHDKIVGRRLAAPLAGLLGADHPITQKLNKGGRLSEAEKQQVRDAATAARDGDSPDALFMAGGPASGKTTVLEENPELAPTHAVKVDPDDLKEDLPEYQALRAAGDHYAATAVHLESGDLAARLAAESSDLLLNVVMDGTGNSEKGSFTRNLLRKRNAGYDVSVIYATTDTDSAVARAVQRAEETGRFVPVPVVREQHAKVSENFEDVAQLDWLIALDVFDDSGHIGSMHNGEFVDIDVAAMTAFREKAGELNA